MQSETLEWLSKEAPAFGQLSSNEKMAIFDFTLLWSFFESHCLGNNANMERIRHYCLQLPHKVVAAKEVEDIAAYFRARYTEEEGYSYRYYHLHLDRSGNPIEVTRMLREDTDNRETLIGCLGIMFRFRNNLFHGEKWEYELQEQKENFERSTGMLRWLMSEHT